MKYNKEKKSIIERIDLYITGLFIALLIEINISVYDVMFNLNMIKQHYKNFKKLGEKGQFKTI